ncbi:MAG: hypothetical protein Q9185_000394 [Variospora sp. 1 TL-2023]
MATSMHKDAHAAFSLSTPPPEPSSTSTTDASSNFDIISTYRSLRRSSPHLTTPLLAISSLLQLLSHTAPSTASETLSLLSHHSSLLVASVRNPIALSAGTELFQRYVVGTLQQQVAPPPPPPAPTTLNNNDNNDGKDNATTQEEEDSFQATRERLLSSGRLFVERAGQARALIAETARKLVKNRGDTVLTTGRSRCVVAALEAAAEVGTGSFRVVYVRSSSSSSSSSSSAPDDDDDDADIIRRLRAKPGVQVAVIRPEAVAYCLGQEAVTAVMVGAEGVVENGGVVSALGTLQLAMLARSARKPLYVLAESHKFVRLYPLGQRDLPVRQTVVEFKGTDDDDDDDGCSNQELVVVVGGAPTRKGEVNGNGGGVERGGGKEEEEEPVDYTPPDLITALVTEAGMLSPSAVSEELIKIWY